MIDFEYTVKVNKQDIDILNKITEAYEGLANIRTIDAKEGIVKILTNSYFIKDVDMMIDKIERVFNIKISVLKKEEWKGVL